MEAKLKQHISVIDDTILSTFIVRCSDNEKKLAAAASAYVEGTENVVFPIRRGGLGLFHMDVNDWWFEISTVVNNIITTINISTKL